MYSAFLFYYTDFKAHCAYFILSVFHTKCGKCVHYVCAFKNFEHIAHINKSWFSHCDFKMSRGVFHFKTPGLPSPRRFQSISISAVCAIFRRDAYPITFSVPSYSGAFCFTSHAGAKQAFSPLSHKPMHDGPWV